MKEPLQPGERIIISTPFKVKIPPSFSRLGHVGESYQITQWYPKPAVYDSQGWHPMPYLDQGEFYSEFGSYDVKITLPKNYVVGATGNLQNEEELAWLDELAKETKEKDWFDKDLSFPPSDSLTKTLHYKADHVHDFAWFADKRFHVLKEEIDIPQSGRKITSWSMFTDLNAELWKKSPEYLRDAVLYFSNWIGEYPYDNLTAVEGALSAGVGMEYPGVTIIGRTKKDLELETVIVHEVGHNWLYGALANNEREHPWMDEGINSFYENRYIEKKYPGIDLLADFKFPRLERFLELDHLKRSYQSELRYLFSATRNQDQPIELPADKYTYINYGTIVYGKCALVFDHLKSYLGDSIFDLAMKRYYDHWKFKHPQPEAVRQTFETVSGKNLNWFFEDIIKTNKKLDYKISKVRKNKGDRNVHEITVKNRSDIQAPFSLSAIKRDTIVKTTWYEGFENKKTVQVINDKYHYYKLDANKNTAEINRQNDIYRLRGMLKKVNTLRFQLIGSINNPERTQLFFTPVVGWNNYDKTMAGVAFYNHTLPYKKLEFEFMPMFGTASRNVVGMGRIGYTFYVNSGKLHNIKFSVSGKRYSYTLFPEVLSYNKVQPVLTFEFRKKNPRSLIDRYFTLRSANIIQDLSDDFASGTNKKSPYNYTVNEASFELLNKRVINPFSYGFFLQQGNAFGKVWAEFKYMLTYNKKNKGLHFRIFAGSFLWTDGDDGAFPASQFRLNYSTGFREFQKDYLFDELYLGRTEYKGIFSQQVFIKDGGFKSITSFGQTTKWLSAININSTLPGRIPIRPYIGFGAFGTENIKFNLAFEAGIAVVIWPDVFEIYIPLATMVQFEMLTFDGYEKATQKWFVGKNRNNESNLNEGKKYWELISFNLNFRNINPFNLLEEIPF